MLNLRIHGDNIVECERAWEIIKKSLFGSSSIKQEISGSVLSPSYEIKVDGLVCVKGQLFPGFGRWSIDIFSYLKERGALLRESADVMISILSNDSQGNYIENPLLAIEFCGALDAGNQAWQRCGRAYSFSMAGIPYIYFTEILGFELGSGRIEKSVRLPNPVVPFAYLTHSLNSPVPALPIFIPSPVTSEVFLNEYSNFFGETELLALIRSILKNEDYSDTIKSIENKTLGFVNALSAGRSKKDTFVEPMWKKWLDHLRNGKDTVSFINEQKLRWSKKAYIKGLTGTAKRIIGFTVNYAIGVGAVEVPICVIPKSKRVDFGNMLVREHPDLSTAFKRWLFKEADLGICWIMGFKPRGDDARPDRGLPPLSRMLLGSSIDIMSFVYGPATLSTWKLFVSNPLQLAKQNGLWESIMSISDAIFIDSFTDHGITEKGYISSHWGKSSPQVISRQIPALESWPTVVGENDVDTIIHLALSTAGDGMVFEGMCNPPGGDWSGISILDDQSELRWLSLPRVSPSRSKRPDHVFQFFMRGRAPIILAIESKERARDIEIGIGGSLVRYVYELFSLPASAERHHKNGDWKNTNRSINLRNYRFASAAAFLLSNQQDMAEVANKAAVDLVFGVKLEKENMRANVSIIARSVIGNELASFIKSAVSISNIRLSVNI